MCKIQWNCPNCGEIIPNNITHECAGNNCYYYCNGCGQYVCGNHICPGTGNFGYYQQEPNYYKCPECKGEFSEAKAKYTGEYRTIDIKELSSNNKIISKQKEPIYVYVCPFCGKEMKGLNQ